MIMYKIYCRKANDDDSGLNKHQRRIEMKTVNLIENDALSDLSEQYERDVEAAKLHVEKVKDLEPGDKYRPYTHDNIDKFNSRLPIMGVYGWFCLYNDKVYIGAAKDIGRRYFIELENMQMCGESPALQADIDKYGIEAFAFRILEVTTDRFQIRNIEDKYLTIYADRLYNIQKDSKFPMPKPCWEDADAVEDAERAMARYTYRSFRLCNLINKFTGWCR